MHAPLGRGQDAKQAGKGPGLQLCSSEEEATEGHAMVRMPQSWPSWASVALSFPGVPYGG